MTGYRVLTLIGVLVGSVLGLLAAGTFTATRLVLSLTLDAVALVLIIRVWRRVRTERPR